MQVGKKTSFGFGATEEECSSCMNNNHLKSHSSECVNKGSELGHDNSSPSPPKVASLEKQEKIAEA